LATGAQAPTEPGTAHDWQVPQAELAQHTPSTQLPEAQSLGTEQAFPSGLRQFPCESQVASPLHVSSWTSRTGEQVPILPVNAQLRHEPSHAVSQHTPSAQNPLPHWAFAVQVTETASSVASGELGAWSPSGPVSAEAASGCVSASGPQPERRKARSRAWPISVEAILSVVIDIPRGWAVSSWGTAGSRPGPARVAGSWSKFDGGRRVAGNGARVTLMPTAPMP
jgi:hypothetical protein